MSIFLLIRRDHLVIFVPKPEGRTQWRAAYVPILAILHKLPLDAEEYPHPAAHDFCKLEAENDEVSVRIRVQVAGELRAPCQPKHEVGYDHERVNG